MYMQLKVANHRRSTHAKHNSGRSCPIFTRQICGVKNVNVRMFRGQTKSGEEGKMLTWSNGRILDEGRNPNEAETRMSHEMKRYEFV
jgi:hypothetical protein